MTAPVSPAVPTCSFFRKLLYSKNGSPRASVRQCRYFQCTRKTSGILHSEWVVQGEVLEPNSARRNESNHPPPKNQKQRGTVLFLHGLLGNSKNLRTPAKRFTLQHPHVSALLLDLRGHGLSNSPFSQPHTISSCTQDVLETLQHGNRTGQEHSPVGVVGHSFGGRCAVQYLHDTIFSQTHHTSTTQETRRKIHPPQFTWVLDSVPGVVHESVFKVVQALVQSSHTFLPSLQKKNDLVIHLTQMGIDPMIASWMTTNLRSVEKKEKDSTASANFEFLFDLEIIQSILDDFPKQDLTTKIHQCASFLQQHHPYSKIILVQAGKNNAWAQPMIQQQMEEIQHLYPSTFQRVVLPKAGHWVHVDDLEGLMNIFHQSFTSPSMTHE